MKHKRDLLSKLQLAKKKADDMGFAATSEALGKLIHDEELLLQKCELETIARINQASLPSVNEVTSNILGERTRGIEIGKVSITLRGSNWH